MIKTKQLADQFDLLLRNKTSVLDLHDVVDAYLPVLNKAFPYMHRNIPLGFADFEEHLVIVCQQLLYQRRRAELYSMFRDPKIAVMSLEDHTSPYQRASMVEDDILDAAFALTVYKPGTELYKEAERKIRDFQNERVKNKVRGFV